VGQSGQVRRYQGGVTPVVNPERQRVEVGLIGCHAVKARMWTSAFASATISGDRSGHSHVGTGQSSIPATDDELRVRLDRPRRP
jgi:hypothetical protein